MLQWLDAKNAVCIASINSEVMLSRFAPIVREADISEVHSNVHQDLSCHMRVQSYIYKEHTAMWHQINMDIVQL